ncbi:MAG TPA: ATP-binding protein [Thermoanaerobaculia bacterium]|jgi:signal transduction histidine kinase
MVSLATAPLTKVGFRRDIRLFLTALVAFFAVLIAVLLILMQQMLGQARDAKWEQFELVASAAENELYKATEANLGVVLTSLRVRYPSLAGATLTRPGGYTVHSGSVIEGQGIESITRRGTYGSLELFFDASDLYALRRTFLLTALITMLATGAGVVMLLLYIPRITGPIEKMLDHAVQMGSRDPGVDEQDFLIDTFRKSLDTMKAQQEELQRLHDQQKTRADEFERITAALTRGLTSGMLALDPEGRIVDANQAGRDILRDHNLNGVSIEEALGNSPFADVLRDAVTHRAPLSRHETTIGALIIGVTTVPLLGEAGDFLGILALFTDLTSIRMLEHRVRDMQTLADLGEMSAGIAHEFRNSLATILGYLKLAQRQTMPDDAVTRIRRAEDEASQLSAAVESLLSFARPMPLQKQSVDLRELVDEVVTRLETTAGEVPIHVTGDGVTLDADRPLFARAIENILRNAIDAVREKGTDGRIDVTLTRDPRTLTIADNGVGLSQDDAARFFLPFQSGKPHGFGLGLPLAKKIVLLHGGSIRMTGAPGEGATVIVEL